MAGNSEREESKQASNMTHAARTTAALQSSSDHSALLFRQDGSPAKSIGLPTASVALKALLIARNGGSGSTPRD
ncbi:MAG: hypothetical protein WDO68_08035 [Gammaproteobacteria bacterium]